MNNFHPTSTAGDGKRFKNFKLAAPGEKLESNFYNCPHCGEKNDRTQVSLPPSDGPGKSYVSVSIAIPGGTRVFIDYVNQSGCRLCGYNYTVSTYKKPLFSTKNFQGK